MYTLLYFNPILLHILKREGECVWERERNKTIKVPNYLKAYGGKNIAIILIVFQGQAFLKVKFTGLWWSFYNCVYNDTMKQH